MMWKFDRFSHHIAVIDESGETLSYKELAEESRKLFQAAKGRCLVMQLCQNTLGSFLGYAAFLEEGIVPAMLAVDIDRDMLTALYKSYTPKYLWAPEEFSYEGCSPVYSRFGYHLLKTPYGDAAKLHPDLALLLTTSGSTGSPKFVRQSYANLRSNTDSIVEYMEITNLERPITTLPMNYTYGLSILNTHLDVGATLLLTHKGIAQKEFWAFFKEQKATSFGGVPYTFEMLDRMRFMRMPLESLTSMNQAGGKLLPSLHEKLAKWCDETGRRFMVMYGQCEASPRMGYLPWQRSLQKAGAMGIAIPGGRFELIDVNGQPIKQPYVTGELRFYGENVTLGYAQSAADLPLGDERHGVLDTGDMAQMDEEGFFTIVGRKKRFLKLFGNRVNLDETERMIKAAFPQTECACSGVDDCLHLFATTETLLPEIRAFLAEKTGLNPSAFITHALAALPKSESGKTLYKELEKYYV